MPLGSASATPVMRPGPTRAKGCSFSRVQKFRRILCVLRHENGCPLNAAAAKVAHRLVRCAQRIPCRGGFYMSLLRQRQKRRGVTPCEIGHRDELTFFPQDAVRERRYIAHVNAAAHDSTATLHGFECGRDQLAGRRKYY